MDEDYEWLSGDDEDSFYYWAITRDILFRLHEFDRKHKSHYFEDDDKKLENSIFNMVQFGRNEEVIYNRLVCKRFSSWKIEELQSEVIFLYRRKHNLYECDESLNNRIKNVVNEWVRISPRILSVRDIPHIILDFYDR